jgi:hypothetical protein
LNTLIALLGFASGWAARGILTDALTKVAIKILTHPIGKEKILESLLKMKDK